MTDSRRHPPPPTKPRQRRLRGILVNLALIIVVYAGVQWYQSRPLASGDAPALSGELLTHTPFDLDAWRGRPVLVHFWATWCPICKLGQDSIARLAEDYAVISVAMQSGGPDEVRGYLAEHDLAVPTLNDPFGEIASAWGVRAVPASFVIGADGQIRFATVGYTSGIGLRGRLWAAAALD
jgi:thiol-disulfide isomerase/thioredoxin